MAAGTVTADGRARVLADGNEIPLLGLGVWQVPDGRECEDAVRWALEAGYRHVDTAQAYGNERSVGRVLRDSGLPREEVFITTKFNPGRRDPEAEVQRSLERLGVDAVDLYIIHWPQGGPTWAWEGMQRAHGRGYARSIGVSNFGASDLRAVLEVADVPPVINQVQFSPFAFRRALLEACDRRGVALEAYSPLGTGRHLGDRRVAAMAERLGRTPAQVLIRWSLQRDLVVLPKSTHRERIERNAQVFDFSSRMRTWGRWTGSTAPAAPTAPWSGPGGEQSGAAPRPWLPPPKVPASCGITSVPEGAAGMEASLTLRRGQLMSWAPCLSLDHTRVPAPPPPSSRGGCRGWHTTPAWPS